ncbi:MAG: AMP-binding protein [Wenzhouxiangellaceae bacterium]|nr:AMP-binding protein [Wenzhouxiangellaceae bacterium]
MTPWLVEAARRWPDAPALLHPRAQLSYRALAERVAAIAGALARGGIEPGQRIGLRLGDDALDNALLLHALWWRGTTIAPQDGASHAPLDGASHAPVIDNLALDHMIAIDPTPGPAIEPVAHHPNWPLTLMQTSGSSGKPRAIAHRPDQHGASIEAVGHRLGLEPGQRWLCCLKFHHIGGLAILLRAVVLGGSVRLLDRFDAKEVAAWLEHSSRAEAIAWISLVPTQLNDLLNAHPERFSTALKGVLVGGAASTPELLDRARARGLPVLPTWGMTEAASQLATPSPEQARSVDFHARPGWAGPPLPGVQVRTDERGRLHVRGPMLSSAPATDPQPDSPWFATGDRGRIDADGDVIVLGRIDRTLISGGINVDLDALERRLRAGDRFEDIALVALPDPRWGERIGAVVVARPDDNSARLEAWARQHLDPPERPARWCLVNEIPRGAAGKPAAETLREMLEDTAGPSR